MKACAIVLGLGCAAACGPSATGGGGGGAWPPAPASASMADQVVWDFEHATLTGQDAFASLFDFAEVGAFEILLHRYDALGRLPGLTDNEVKALLAEEPVPYPEARERRNVSRFFPRFVQRTVGTGGCTGAAPRYHYNQLLGVTYPPLPPDHAHYDALRQRINHQLEGGGVIGIRCTGGTGGLALVYSPRSNARGYDLVTIYDDGAD